MFDDSTVLSKQLPEILQCQVSREIKFPNKMYGNILRESRLIRVRGFKWSEIFSSLVKKSVSVARHFTNGLLIYLVKLDEGLFFFVCGVSCGAASVEKQWR